MNVFEEIRKNKSKKAQAQNQAKANTLGTKNGRSNKVTAGKVGSLSAVCPVCSKPMEKAYSKGIPVICCVDHNIVLPDIKE